MTMLRLVAIALACAGCQDHTNDQPPPSASLPPAVPKPSARLDGKRQQRMRNCPSAVPSAKTSVTSTATTVDILITAPDPDARRAVLARARYNAQLHDPVPMWLPFVVHTGLHTGTGGDGFCPVIHAATQITVEEIPAGVIIHEQPYDPGMVKDLYDAVAARIQALQPSPQPNA
jgi:hypothetical protein